MTSTVPFALIPKPASITPRPGTFSLILSTVISSQPTGLAIAQELKSYLQSTTNLPFHISEELDNTPGQIRLLLEESAVGLRDEGYRLNVKPGGIELIAAAPAGLFYGVQSLRQLLPLKVENGEWQIPCVEIEDQPRFKWRGMMLDTARHMFTVEEIKRILDQMAFHKYNRFHWHITDDQGWRIEIKKYPGLTEVGAHRKSTPIPAKPHRSDETPYGGYYTQEQIREIVAYAADRFITVVPEIDMPGHAVAAMAAYPELGCTGGPYEVRTKWGIEYDVYCAGNEKVYAFLEDVLTEVLELFPSEVIHAGGDEVPKDRWRECPKCQAKIQDEGLTNEDELQSYFIRRMERFLNSKGRKLIGWDEILEGCLAPNAMVMSWRGIQGGIEAANAGHEVVMSPITNCYFDYRQHESKKMEPPAIRAVLLLENVYAFEPIPEELTPEAGAYILGVQGNLWTEYIPSFEHLQYMAWPRGCALAEVGWSGTERNHQEFMVRLENHLKRLDTLGVNYRDPFVERELHSPAK